MSSFKIKLIAVITMLIDHIGIILHEYYTDAIILRFIGRVSFPLFVYLISIGCIHTKNIKKYMVRIGCFAIISQVPFAVFNQVNLLENLNIFFTLFMGMILIYFYDLIKNKGVIHLLAFIFVFAFVYFMADIINVDYGGIGVMFIIIVYLANISKFRKILVTSSILVMLFMLYTPTSINMLIIFLWATLSIIPILLYNGKHGKKVNKLVFYSFYPIHMIILSVLRYFITY